MKYIYVFILFLVVSCTSKDKSDDEKKSYPELVLTSRIIDFKNVKQGEVLKAKYEFINPSNDTLKIKYVNPDCVCTGYELSSKIIPPKNKGLITLILDTKSKYGNNALHAIIKANTKTKFYKITLKANVIE